MYVCMYIYIFIYSLYSYICIYISTCFYLLLRLCFRTFRRSSLLFLTPRSSRTRRTIAPRVNTHTHTHTCICIYIYIYVYMYIYIYIYIYIYMYIYIYIYTYIYIYICIYTYIYVYICIYIVFSSSSCLCFRTSRPNSPFFSTPRSLLRVTFFGLTLRGVNP